MSSLLQAIVTILTSLIGAAIVATLVSSRAKTSEIISSSWTGFNNSLGTALSPVTR